MYAFEAGGAACLDEPLYRAWLLAHPSVERPYRENLIHGKPHPDHGAPEAWAREWLSLEDRCQARQDAPYIFCKHMAKHASQYDFSNEVPGFRHKHLLLLRDPFAVLSSWNVSKEVHGEAVSLDEVGIVPLLHIFSQVPSAVLLDAQDLIDDPAKALRETWEALGVPYTDDMLTWKSGPHECDGPWAGWWYHQVHQSTGWKTEAALSKTYRTLPPSLLPALRGSLPAYQFLQSLKPNRYQPPYEDPRNRDLLVYIGTPGHGQLMPREQAGISPWDSSVQGGDATWEGIRVYRGKILSLDAHLTRLERSAKALGFEQRHTKEQITEAIFQTLAANGMRDGAHIRLTLTRGEKYTSSMNPVFNVYGTTLIVLAEWKPTEGATTYDNTDGIVLITASQRRNSPQTVDSKIHHNNLINNILPKIQANLAGAADALMLDLNGFVSETNATNIFMVQDGILLTPHADACLPGITRATVLQLAETLGIPTEVRNISLAEFHAADEVFTTGTMGALTPVKRIDGRVIGPRGPITARLQEAYQTLPEKEGWATPLPPFEEL